MILKIDYYQFLFRYQISKENMIKIEYVSRTV